MRGAGGWTPERRAAQAERCRRLSQDAAICAKRNASLNTSPKARAARRANALRMCADPLAQEKSRAWRETPQGKAALAAAARRLCELRAAEGPIRDAWLAGTARSNGSDKKRAASAATLRALHRRPEFRKKQAILLSRLQRDPAARSRMAATRRAGVVPKGTSKRYRQLRDLIGAQAAMRIVRREVAIAKVNASSKSHAVIPDRTNMTPATTAM